MQVNNEMTISNGNVNASRDSVNRNISNYAILGRSMKIALDNKRKFRSI